MPVTEVVPWVAANPSGGDTYPFPFRVLDPAHVVVRVCGVQQVMGTHYAVNLADPEGGAVVFQPGHLPAADPAGDNGQVEIFRSTPLARETDYKEAGGFFADVVNRDIDAVVMMLQDVKQTVAQLVDAASHGGIFYDSQGRGFSIQIASAGPDQNNEEIFYPIIKQLT